MNGTLRCAGCALCEQAGGMVVHQAERWRVVRVEDVDFPGFYRVVWNDHVAEWTDLGSADRAACMQAVAAVEQALRAGLQPTKINLASLGNAVPHLHWHVVARFAWDSRFPQPIWAAAQRTVAPPAVERLPLTLSALDATLRLALLPLAAQSAH